MKHIKKFDSKKDSSKKEEPQIGDYVICEEPLTIHIFEELNRFISSNIGQIVQIDDELPDRYFIQYLNIPENLKLFFKYLKKITNCRAMRRKNIIYWSRNKEDLEVILSSNKYNL